jgi:hypothetical protein
MCTYGTYRSVRVRMSSNILRVASPRTSSCEQANSDLRPIGIDSPRRGADSDTYSHGILASGRIRCSLTMGYTVNPRSLQLGRSRPLNLICRTRATGRWLLLRLDLRLALISSPEFATAELADYAFSLREQAAFASIPPDRRTVAFFKCWTSKEAYIKGLGCGMVLPLQLFEVCPHPDMPARLVRPYQGAINGSGWSLHGLDPGPGYAATLAAARTPTRILKFEWCHAKASFTPHPETVPEQSSAPIPCGVRSQSPRDAVIKPVIVRGWPL